MVIGGVIGRVNEPHTRVEYMRVKLDVKQTYSIIN